MIFIILKFQENLILIAAKAAILGNQPRATATALLAKLESSPTVVTQLFIAECYLEKGDAPHVAEEALTLEIMLEKSPRPTIRNSALETLVRCYLWMDQLAKAISLVQYVHKNAPKKSKKSVQI